MSFVEKEIIVKNSQGLHARPAAMFVQIVSKYDAEVTLIKDEEEVSGKSIMGILTLGVQQHSRVRIRVDGEQATTVLNELEQLLSREEIV